LQPSQLLAEFLGIVAHGTRDVVRLIGIYAQMIHDFLDGFALSKTSLWPPEGVSRHQFVVT
jgi:hypothetical protein